MRSRFLPVALVLIISVLIIVGIIYQQNQKNQAQHVEGATQHQPVEAASPLPVGTQPPGTPTPDGATAATGPGNASPAPASPVDLSVDANGLSKATVVLNTTQGVIKFKFYPKDAPNTVNRIVELIQQGFYNSLSFHRVVPGFVIQGGDPQGNGTGGSGKKLKAEFNSRRHIEGTVAMARAADPDSADSQFYISLGTHPHLDREYTVFGQVIEGMDIARKIKPGDKMTSVTIQ